MTTTIEYVTGYDGWGDSEPTEEDCATFCALVEERVGAAYPGHYVSATVSRRALESAVTSADEAIDCDEVCSWIGTDVWDAWCSGERAAS